VKNGIPADANVRFRPEADLQVECAVFLKKVKIILLRPQLFTDITGDQRLSVLLNFR